MRQGSSSDRANDEPEPAGLFGLDRAEAAILAELLAEAAAPLGIDGAALVEGLRQGRSLGDALRLPPGLNGLLYANAHTWFAAGRPDRAEALFRTLCVLDGAEADHWIGYGVCLRVRERLQEADLAFMTAVSLRPDWAVAHLHAAALALATGHRARAVNHLDVFDRCDAPDVHTSLRQEAARLRLALSTRTAASLAPAHRGA